MTDPYLQLRQLVNAIHILDEKDWTAFERIWKSYTAKRKEQLTTAGDREKYLYFIVDGVQRVYYYDDQDREATLVFSYAPSFGGVIDSFLLQQPSKYFFETLTQSEFLRAPYDNLHELMVLSPAIELMIRKGLTFAFSGLLERLAELQCYSSEEKFRKLLQRSPHILGLVPHKYLANYLGIDASNFSKLVNRIRI